MADPSCRKGDGIRDGIVGGRNPIIVRTKEDTLPIGTMSRSIRGENDARDGG
jgi:hypothetical protein